MDIGIIKALSSIAAGVGFLLLRNDTKTEDQSTQITTQEPTAIKPVVIVPNQTRQTTEFIDEDSKQTISDKDIPSQASNENNSYAETIEDKRLNPLYMGDVNAPYDEFYDWSNDDQIAYNSEGKDSFRYYATDPTAAFHVRIIRPFIATETVSVGLNSRKTDGKYSWYDCSMLDRINDTSNSGIQDEVAEKYLRSYICNNDAMDYFSFVRGNARNVELLVEIHNPTELEVPLCKLVIDNINIGGIPCQIFSPSLHTLSTEDARKEGSEKLATMRNLPLEIIPFKYAKSSVYYKYYGSLDKKAYDEALANKINECATEEDQSYLDNRYVDQYEYIPPRSSGLYVIKIPMLVTNVKSRFFARPFLVYEDKGEAFVETGKKRIDQANLFSFDQIYFELHEYLKEISEDNMSIDLDLNPPSLSLLNPKTKPEQLRKELDLMFKGKTKTKNKIKGIAFFDFQAPEFRTGDEISMRIRVYDDLNKFKVDPYDIVTFGNVRTHYISLQSGLVSAKSEMPKDSSVFISYYDNRLDLPKQTGTLDENWNQLLAEYEMPEQTKFNNKDLPLENKIDICSTYFGIPSAIQVANAISNFSTSSEEASVIFDNMKVSFPDDVNTKTWLKPIVLAAAVMSNNEPVDDDMSSMFEIGFTRLVPQYRLDYDVNTVVAFAMIIKKYIYGEQARQFASIVAAKAFLQKFNRDTEVNESLKTAIVNAYASVQQGIEL